MNRTAAALAALLLPIFLSPIAHAQDAKPAAAAPVADPAAVRRDLYDLGLLRSLQDVIFTDDQIKAIVPVLKQVHEDDKARLKKDDDTVRELAAGVAKARADALEGTPIPQEIEDRVADQQKAATARLDAARHDATEKVLTVLWPLLTDAQKSAIEVQSRAFYGGRRVPAAYRSDPAHAPKDEVQKLAVGGFIENVLLDDRAVPLLEALKPTAPADAGTPAAKP